MTTPNLQLNEFGAVGVPSGADLSSSMRRLDAVVQLSASGFVSEPPALPALGDRVIVNPPGTGVFLNHDLHVAYKTQTGWEFLIPEDGWVAVVGSPQVLYVFDSSVPAWTLYEPPKLKTLSITRVVGARFTGGGTNEIEAPTDAVQFEVPFTGTIQKVVVSTESGPGIAFIDIRKGAAYPVGAGNSIVSGSPSGILVSSSSYLEDDDLLGWDKELTEGDWLSFVLESSSVFTAITIQLFVEVPL